MRIVEVPVEMEWQEWQSEAGDLERMPLQASLRILFELFLINAFERTVVRLKQQDCVHGPIHISLGQEAVAAAVVTALQRSDRISGSHRAHHVFLAKVLGYFLPEAWDPLKEPLPEPAQEVVTRTLAEIMGLGLGYCGGRGGSMHLRHLEAGVLGTNAIVSGGLPLSAGAAFAELKSGRRNLVCAFFGDGGINQGSFHESANLAALWNLPIVYFVENNQYAVATRIRDASAVTALAQHAASYGMRARTVHGHDVVGLYLAMQAVAESIRSGGSPCLIDARCYRHLHHGGDLPGSAFGYRTKEEEAEWLARDACRAFPLQLVEARLANEGDVERLRSLAELSVAAALRTCTTEQGAKLVVRPELWPDPGLWSTACAATGRSSAGCPTGSVMTFPSSTRSNTQTPLRRLRGGGWSATAPSW